MEGWQHQGMEQKVTVGTHSELRYPSAWIWKQLFVVGPQLVGVGSIPRLGTRRMGVSASPSLLVITRLLAHDRRLRNVGCGEVHHPCSSVPCSVYCPALVVWQSLALLWPSFR